MNRFPVVLRLLLTMVLSFMTPILLINGGLISFTIVAQFPISETWGEFWSHQILSFLATFGSGHPWLGALVIGTTCSFVGALFDTYVVSQHQRSS